VANLGPIPAQVANQGADANVLARLAMNAWTNATERRRVANFCGGGYRSGNRSKCMCSQAVRDTLVDTGLCREYGADALAAHTSGALRNNCPGLSLSSSRSIANAPAGAVIVYNGYAGSTPHNYGHIEIKVEVTQELLNTVRNDPVLIDRGQAQNLRVGDFLYCSDFCRAAPTDTPNNEVVAIYTIN